MGNEFFHSLIFLCDLRRILLSYLRNPMSTIAQTEPLAEGASRPFHAPHEGVPSDRAKQYNRTKLTIGIASSILSFVVVLALVVSGFSGYLRDWALARSQNKRLKKASKPALKASKLLSLAA